MTDRVDEAVEFALPTPAEREGLLALYFDKCILQTGKALPIRVDEGVSQDWAAMAARLEGFSGRQISKLATAWQAAAHASVDNCITQEMMDQIVDSQLAQKQSKVRWADAALH